MRDKIYLKNNEVNELWICLACGKAFCSRYKQNHYKSHFDENPTHSICLGVLDCTVWCYLCPNLVLEDVGNYILTVETTPYVKIVEEFKAKMEKEEKKEEITEPKDKQSEEKKDESPESKEQKESEKKEEKAEDQKEKAAEKEKEEEKKDKEKVEQIAVCLENLEIGKEYEDRMLLVRGYEEEVDI